MSAIAPTTSAGLGHQKQYVFVDEYNRHKRLKVMRACDGCRKRKIRCDGALQNGPWPCGACVRLKLKCSPPTLDQEDEPTTPDSPTGSSIFTFQANPLPIAPTSNPINVRQSASPTVSHATNEWIGTSAGTLLTPISAGPQGPTSNPDFDLNAAYAAQPPAPQYTPQLGSSYSNHDEYFVPSTEQSQYHSSQPVNNLLFRTETVVSDASSADPHEINAVVHELSGRMGDMMIDVTSAAPYITKHHKVIGDTPTVDDRDVILPASVFTDAAVRIPVEMMPSEERALDYFGYYFDHIHPYVPVLNRRAFYDQWNAARATISPLILEAIFACVACYLEEPIEARKWLALAAKHEDSFKDVPRLSTIQAMIILMKARESFPKPGYYYRSWMTVKYMVSMGFDLGLDEHWEQHRDGKNSCPFSRSECMIRTRVWQCLHVLEIMVGAPQGRTDFTIDTETVQLVPPTSSTEVDAFELQMSRRSTYIAQAIRDIKLSYQLCLTLRKKRKDWALDPEFTKHNEDLPMWLRDLPADVQIHYTDDTSPPWLGGDHWLASLHAYHHLMIIMHHRPQLLAMLEKGDLGFRQHLEICLASAIKMCRLQEALYRDFGLHGLQFMTRGINFTVYCVLTCMMLHLAAITAPDHDVNTRARAFFSRHMRILELCLPSSTPEMMLQINALREAFSADTSKPFELKSTLGLKSPSPREPTPPETHADGLHAAAFSTPTWSNMVDRVPDKNLTPISDYSGPMDNIAPDTIAPVSMPFQTSTYDLSPSEAYVNPGLPNSNNAYALKHTISNDHPPHVWDPSGIFIQWNNAFGPSAAPTPSIPQQPSMPPTSGSTSAAMQLHPSQSYPPGPTNMQVPMPDPNGHTAAVTPGMWQDAFTNAFVSGHGVKRYRQASLEHTPYDLQYKRRG